MHPSCGDLGALACLDAGRVYAEGQSSGGWHTGRGAGVCVTYAFGERSAIYLRLSLPY